MNGAGIAEVNGTGLYCEVKGEGDRLVLVHDGLLAAGSGTTNSTLLPKGRR